MVCLLLRQDKIKKLGLEQEFYVCSSATSTEEIWGDVGNPVYPPAKEELKKHGISCDGKRAIQAKKQDYENYDLFVVMDRYNQRNLYNIFGHDKDNKIVKRHIAQLELNYYIGKLKRFTADSYKVTMGFKHSQLNDTRIITKFALSYLKSVFEYVQPVNGSMTDLFKRQWGLRDRKESKDRTNYKHHIIDALTIACVNRGKYNLLCEIIKNSSDGKHIRIPKPWEDFDSDVLKAVEYVIPKHFVVDNALRQSKKLLKDRFGKPIIKNGHVVYKKGNTVRGSLHKDTFYNSTTSLLPCLQNK